MHMKPRRYVKEMRRSNYSEAQIRAQLLANEWDQKTVTKAMRPNYYDKIWPIIITLAAVFSIGVYFAAQTSQPSDGQNSVDTPTAQTIDYAQQNQQIQADLATIAGFAEAYALANNGLVPNDIVSVAEFQQQYLVGDQGPINPVTESPYQAVVSSTILNDGQVSFINARCLDQFRINDSTYGQEGSYAAALTRSNNGYFCQELSGRFPDPEAFQPGPGGQAE